MDTHSLLKYPKASEAVDPHAGQAGVAAGAARSPEEERDDVCYCGLYEKCPDWLRMNDEERRVCSTDKRMTMEWLWKGGVQGA